MDPFAFVNAALAVYSAVERAQMMRIEAAKREEAEAVAVHLDRTRAAQAVIASVRLSDGPSS